MTTHPVQITEADLPADLVWDTPPENRGQTVLVSYGRRGATRTEACSDSDWQRIVDQSEPVSSPERVRYFQRDLAVDGAAPRYHVDIIVQTTRLAHPVKRKLLEQLSDGRWKVQDITGQRRPITRVKESTLDKDYRIVSA